MASGTMNAALLDNDYIPLTSPYDDEKTVAAIPSGAVDWVYVQLRETSSGAVVSARSAFLKSNGYLMDDEGGETILMPLPAGGESNYYIVVRHRNHLDIMSDEVHYLYASGHTTYDFTTGQDQAWGVAPMIDLGSGVFGMITGDADANGDIESSDRTLVFNQSGQVGYRATDMNMNGDVESSDRILSFYNSGLGSLIP